MITSDDIAKYKVKIAHFSHNSDDFLEKKVKELINKLIVDHITWRMRANEVHQKIWEKTTIKDISITKDKIKAVIHNEYFAESGFDVALARERGTKDHWIAPRVKLLLSWIQDGRRMFSKGHMVSGLKSLYIIRNTVLANTPLVQEALNNEFGLWRDSIFK